MHSSSQDPMNLYAFAQLLRRRVWWVVGCLALTMGLGVVYLQQAEPVYRVHARILVEQKGLASARERAERDKDFLATQAEIIRSPAVVSQAVETLGLKATSPDDPSSVVGILEHLSVNPLLGTNVLSVSLQGPDAGRATRIVETVIESYREYIRESERGVHLEALRALTASEKEVRKDLQELEADYRELRQNSPLVGRGDEGVRLQRELLAHLGQTLSDVKSRRMELENRLVPLDRQREANLASAESTRIVPVSTASADQGNSDLHGGRPEQTPSSHLVDTSRQLLLQYAKGAAGDIAHVQEQLFAAQAREKELTEKYGPKHAAVRGVREQIAGWQTQLREQQAAAPLVLQQELDAARLQEQQLADLYREEFAEAKGINNWLLEEQQGLGHIERTREVHESILSQIRQWQLVDQALAQGKTEIAVRVLEEPSLDETQVWPPNLLVLAACALVGLMGGVGLILSLGNPAEVAIGDSALRVNVALPIWGRIPTMPRQQSFRAALDAPQSSAAAAFRRLATRLGEVKSADGSTGLAVQVAAVASGAGATTLIGNLALSLAQQGRKVAVVDADRQQGRLGERLGVSGSLGLEAVLREQVGLEDALQRSPFGSVDVLGRGTRLSASPVDSWGEAELSGVLDSLRSHYEFVLVDAPAIAQGDDALAVASTVDGVLLLVAEGTIGSVAVEQACRRLRAAGVPPLGAILNHTEEAVSNSTAREPSPA